MTGKVYSKEIAAVNQGVSVPTESTGLTCQGDKICAQVNAGTVFFVCLCNDKVNTYVFQCKTCPFMINELLKLHNHSSMKPFSFISISRVESGTTKRNY